jgi:hypothetical protein
MVVRGVVSQPELDDRILGPCRQVKEKVGNLQRLGR